MVLGDGGAPLFIDGGGGRTRRQTRLILDFSMMALDFHYYYVLIPIFWSSDFKVMFFLTPRLKIASNLN